MAATWVAGSTFVTDFATSVNATTPAGIADDDVLLAGVFARSAITTPSGWTKLLETAEFEFDGASILQRLAVFQKNTVTSADASQSLNWAQASEDRMGVVYAVARDADQTPAQTAANVVNQTDTWQITPTTVTATENGELFIAFGSSIASTGDAETPGVPASFTLASGAAQTNYRIAVAYRTANNSDSSSGAFHFDPDSGGLLPSADYGIGLNGLGAIILRLSPLSAAAVEARVEVETMLGTPAALGYSSKEVRAAADSPLGAVLARAMHDFTGELVDAPSSYVMDLITPDGAVRVPVRSCQATIQTGQALYAQCVVPAVLQWASTISEATEFALYRVGRLADGRSVEACLARHALQTVQFAQGPFNYSATLSGYADALAEVTPPFGPRALEDVRATFITGTNYRIRCAPDWLIAPGHTVTYGATSFTASYINHYATGSDQYIDVGQRSDG